MRELKRFAVLFLSASCVILGLAAPSALAASTGYAVSPVTDLSSACSGQNAEVEQAVAPPHYVYEAWIGCGGEGFSFSSDGGAHFSAPVTLPDSSGSDDPAVTVSPDGVVYVSYLRYYNGYSYPVVATSFDHGKTFTASSLIPPVKNNWGDRDFIAAGRGGTVYVTWDYGPSFSDVKIVCAPDGSCAYGAVDATAVVQKSTDYGKTWGPVTPMQPGFPAGGGYDASVVVQPDGVVDALMIDHPLDAGTYTVHPGHEVFTRSTDGGKTWSRGVEVGASAGTLSDTEWWIDGDLSTDRAGNLYATWDTQSPSGDSDIGWLSYSVNGGRSWSAPIRVTPDQDNVVHIVESAGEGPGIAAIAWQADNSPQGYATYLRPFSITRGWLAPVTQVSSAYGNPSIWPGDTFGLSALPGAHGPAGSGPVALSWGSATGGSQDSEIYSAVARPAHP